MKKPLALSLFLHSILFAFMIVSLPAGCGGGGEGDSEEKTEGAKHSKRKDEKNGDLQAAESQAEKTVTIDILSKEEADAIAREAKCKTWFGGIGVSHDMFGRVSDCPEWYPAYKAGIRLGDVIISDLVRGEIGTVATVQVYRNHTLLTFEVVRAKICYEEKEQ